MTAQADRVGAVHLAGLLRDVLDFCYPGICAACRARCEAEAMLCGECTGALDKLEAAAVCGLCGMPVAEQGAPCPYCRGAGVAHYDRVVRLGTFDEPLKGLIHQMKYRGRWGIAERLAERLAARERVKESLAEAEVLVPVPLHRFRQFWRGFNQAEVIARRLGKARGIPIARPLVRVRHTPTQTHQHSRAHRFENLKDAFALVAPASVREKHVVVVDDVMTTGATLQTVARALKPAEPASLSALVLAIADPRGRDFRAV